MSCIDLVGISTSQGRRIVWLIGQLQGYLEAEIDAVIVPGTNEANPHDAEEAQQLARARRTWSRAERIVEALTR